MFLDQLAHGDAHLLLDDAGVVDVARDAEQFGARVVFAAQVCEPVAAAAQDGRDVRDGFDVGDRGRAAVQTYHCWERWFHAGFALFALEGFDQSGLLPADLRASAPLHSDSAVEVCAAHIVAEQPFLFSFPDSLFEHVSFMPLLSSYLNIAICRVHRFAHQHHAFNQFVRVVAHDFPVLARPGF